MISRGIYICFTFRWLSSVRCAFWPRHSWSWEDKGKVQCHGQKEQGPPTAEMENIQVPKNCSHWSFKKKKVRIAISVQIVLRSRVRPVRNGGLVVFSSQQSAHIHLKSKCVFTQVGRMSLSYSRHSFHKRGPGKTAELEKPSVPWKFQDKLPPKLFCATAIPDY